MDESSPWREVAIQFAQIRLEDEDRLTASWRSDGWSAVEGDTWRLSGVEDARILEKFRWAAERAAVLLSEMPGSATLFFWLDILRNGSPNYQPMPCRRNIDGAEVEVDIGAIQSVCMASEEYCFKLETEHIAKVMAQKAYEPIRKMIERTRSQSPKDSMEVREAQQMLRIEASAEARAREQILYEKRLTELRRSEELENLREWPGSIKETTRTERCVLRDQYFASFPEKIMILDVCWAAKEHYREWKRWLQKPSPIKDGAKPDLAFRAILASGKRPLEYRSVKRSPKWK